MVVRLTRLGWLVLAASMVLSEFAARAASITGFAPDKGGSGTEIAVSGTGLQTAAFVYFGSTEAPGEIVSRSANVVRVRVPANAFTGQISVFTTASGSASSSQVFVAAPRITDFDPLSGDVGTVVRISGVNFATTSGTARGAITNVLFQGQRTAFQVSGINQLLAVVPTNAVSGPITVANEAGSFTTLLPFQVAAAVNGFSPVSGKAGDSIEVRGRNLLAALRVEVGGVQAAFEAVSVTNLFVRIPTNAVDGRIQLVTPAGTTSTSSNLLVLPRVLAFTPTGGAVGASVLITGGGFHGLTEVQINGVKATVTASSAQSLTVQVPNGAATGPITVKTANGTFVTAESFFLPARVMSFNPSSGARGTAVTLDGVNLSAMRRVLFNGVPAEFTQVSGTRLVATVPALATSGRITVESPGGTNDSNGSFTVRPVIDGFQPASGAVGIPVTLSGAGLTNVTQARLGDLDATFTVVNSTQVRVIVPLGAFSGPLWLRTAAGDAQAAGNFFVDGARPTLTAVQPGSGAVGSKVTLKGTGLRTASKVEFGGVSAAFSVVSGAEISATVPTDAASGVVAVTTLDGIAVSATPFEVVSGSVTLAVERSGEQLILRWPAASTGYVLEYATSLPAAGNSWQTAPETPVEVGTEKRVTVTLPDVGVRYYRLRR